MSLYKAPEYTTHNTAPFPANSSDYIPDCIHIHLDMISPSTFQRQPIDQVDMDLDCQPWKEIIMIN